MFVLNIGTHWLPYLGPLVFQSVFLTSLTQFVGLYFVLQPPVCQPTLLASLTQVVLLYFVVQPPAFQSVLVGFLNLAFPRTLVLSFAVYVVALLCILAYS